MQSAYPGDCPILNKKVKCSPHLSTNIQVAIFPKKDSIYCTISYQQCDIIPWYISYSTLTWHNIHCVVIFHPFYMPLLAKNILNYNNELVTLHWCHSRQENAYMKVPLLTTLAFVSLLHSSPHLTPQATLA